MLLFFPGRAQEVMTDGEDGAQDLSVLFWNVENLFDCDGSNGGKEWTPEGDKHWTPGRLRTKCNAIGKTLLWIGEQCGRLPDIVGLAEVENARVLRRLVFSAPLRKAGYRYIHFDSPDPRGIDVALLYREECFAFNGPEDTPGDNGDNVTLQACPGRNASHGPRCEAIPIPGFRTRDMLRCHFPLKRRNRPGHSPHDSLSCDTLTLLVVHHPSKLGGADRSQSRRETAMRALRDACLADSRSHARALTVVTGDFNDTPDGAAFRMLDSCLICPSRALHQRGEGSLKYDGKWELIDQFWVSPDLAAADSPTGLAPGCTTAVIYAPFLLTRDSAHAGEKPLRTYSGPRYLGGVSDHLPIILKLRLPGTEKGRKDERTYSSSE